MALFYVTGVSGTGKSQVLKELQTRGYEAHGTDEHGFAYWINKASGKIEVLPENQPKFDIHKWFAEHDWILNDTKIAQLKDQASTSDKTIFLCGLADGEDKVWHMFAKVFILTVDKQTLQQRIRQRTDNDFGKAQDEMKSILKWLSKSEKRYKNLGAIPINATQSVPKVVNDIINNLSQ